MRFHTAALTVFLVLIALSCGAQGSRRLSRAELEDKIRGGWAGQMIGVSYGAPTEFRYKRRMITGPIVWAPDNVSNAIDQDDLYVEMTFAEVLDTVGLNATTEQFGDMFKDSKYELWHANAAARILLNHGIKAPLSGDPRYNAHANDIDFQIESDFIGLMTPGLPQQANAFADRVGRVMNYGDGLYGGMFFGGMYAAAFFENDPRKVVEMGLRSIPADSGYAKVIADVLQWSAENPDDWQKTWQRITDKWDHNDICPDGALDDFNIDARLNGAFVALGLIYGQRDFAKTLEVSTRSGQDSDCNPSSAAGILGVMLGYDKIPDEWKSGIAKLADTKFSYTQYSFNGITASTMKRALSVIERAGGTVSDTEVTIPAQEPKAPPLEQWVVDPPSARLDVKSDAWTWAPGWTPGAGDTNVMSATEVGAEATLKFKGTGVAVLGKYRPDGGRGDVLLDGKKAGEIQAKQVPHTNDNVYWIVTGLTSGAHTLQIRVAASDTGSGLWIERAVVYGN